MSNTQVILSGFADEAANEKLAIQQFAALAAVGLQHYSIRFIDVGTSGGIWGLAEGYSMMVGGEPGQPEARGARLVSHWQQHSARQRAPSR